MQPYYASDLLPQTAGLVLGGLPLNFTGAMGLLDHTPEAGLVPNALLGITSQFSPAREYLVLRLKRGQQKRFLMLKNTPLSKDS